MKKTEKHIQLTALELNTGQIDWLPRNPRQWTKDDLDLMIKSLEEDPDYMDDRPPLVTPIPSKPGFFAVFAGNLRVFTAKKINSFSELKCIVYLPEDENDKVTVIRRAMKDNGHFGEWDNDILANEWDCFPLKQWGVPIPWTEDKEEKKEAKEDDFDESKDCIEVRCKPGDIWQLGEHRLMCGDSINLEDVRKLMGGAIADMVFTDPPYGVSIGDKNKALNAVQKAGQQTENIANDTLKADELYKVLVKAMTNCRMSCKEDASYFVSSPQWGELGLMMMMMMKDAGLPVRHVLIWEKNCATFSLGRLDYDYQHEQIFYTWTKSHHNYRKGEYRTTVWKYDKPRKCDLHPTMKPVELVANCINDCSKEGDIILDIFGGSGTTLIAAEQLGRKAYLMELNPHYCDVILSRWEKLTGKTAVKIN